MAEIDADYRVVGFEEKPQHDAPRRSRFDPSMISASMGIYVFKTEVLLRALHEDAQRLRLQPRFRQGRDPAPPRARAAW